MDSASSPYILVLVLLCFEKQQSSICAGIYTMTAHSPEVHNFYIQIIYISPRLNLRPLFGFLCSIPLHTILEPHALPSKNVQGTSNCQIHLAVTQPLHQLQILQIPSSACIRHRDTAPFCQFADQFLVDPSLQAFVVRGVDEEFGAVRLQPLYALYGFSSATLPSKTLPSNPKTVQATGQEDNKTNLH